MQQQHGGVKYHRGRMGEAFREEIIALVEGELSDPRIGLVSVNEVQIAPDGRSARVRFAEVRPGYKNGGTWLPTKWLDGLDNRHQDDPVVIQCV